jgi:hypothetical protein
MRIGGSISKTLEAWIDQEECSEIKGKEPVLQHQKMGANQWTHNNTHLLKEPLGMGRESGENQHRLDIYSGGASIVQCNRLPSEMELRKESYRHEVKEGIWNIQQGEKGIASDQQAQKAARKVNNIRSASTGDVEGPQDLMEFVQDISVITATAKQQKSGEKWLLAGRDMDGNIVVRRIGISGRQGGGVPKKFFHDGIIGLIHVHPYGGLNSVDPRPGPADHHVVKAVGIPNYVIGKNGRSIYEVGRQQGRYKYRALRGQQPGFWRILRGAR